MSIAYLKSQAQSMGYTVTETETTCIIHFDEYSLTIGKTAASQITDTQINNLLERAQHKHNWI